MVKSLGAKRSRKKIGKKAVGHLTTLQIVTVIALMAVFVVWSISTMEAVSSDRRPSETLFNNSQTVEILNV